MISIIIVLISIGSLGLVLTDVSLIFDKDTAIYGGINMICTILLCAGMLMCCNKTQEVYCPKCGDKKDAVFVELDEHYCAKCGSEYVVVG